jgi:hypothetical protein
MKFTLEIELGFEAMQTRKDLEEVLRKLGQNLMYLNEIPKVGDNGRIRVNGGNTVGKWEVTA